MSDVQRTIERDVGFSGVGLHTGARCTVRIRPAPPDNGIVFVRTDVPGRPRIPATVDHVVNTARQTTLSSGEVEIQTVEHLLASLSGCGVDNAVIEVDGIEVPGGDGSALDFVTRIREVGIREHPGTTRRRVRVEDPVSVTEGDVSLVALPSTNGPGLSVSYTLDYRTPYFPSQHLALGVDPESFVREIAPARTFCLEAEVEGLRAKGFGKGASYENTLVISPDGIRENTLRFQDEFVRHKILDLIGDLSLLNAEIDGHIIAVKSGHPANVELVRRLRRKLAGGNGTGRNLLPTAPEEDHAVRALDIREILRILPHRYPFLLIDRVVEMVPGKRVTAIKNVTFNEHFFQGHFPGRPVMPGVLQIEAMAQAAGVLLLDLVRVEGRQILAFLMTIDKVKLRRTVEPGDRLVLDVRVIRIRSRTGEVAARASVGGKRVAEARMKFMLVEA